MVARWGECGVSDRNGTAAWIQTELRRVYHTTDRHTVRSCSFDLERTGTRVLYYRSACGTKLQLCSGKNRDVCTVLQIDMHYETAVSLQVKRGFHTGVKRDNWTSPGTAGTGTAYLKWMPPWGFLPLVQSIEEKYSIFFFFKSSLHSKNMINNSKNSNYPTDKKTTYIHHEFQ